MTSRRSPTTNDLIKPPRVSLSAETNILQTLLAIQAASGYVPVETLPSIAARLDVTEAEVAGVLSYYPDLRTTSPGCHLVRICMGESCAANHCQAVFRAIETYVHLKSDKRNGNTFTIEKVYCVGNCAVSPTVVVDQDIHGRVNPLEVPALLERYR